MASQINSLDRKIDQLNTLVSGIDNETRPAVTKLG